MFSSIFKKVGEFENELARSTSFPGSSAGAGGSPTSDQAIINNPTMTDAQKIAALVSALDKSRATQNQILGENANLKKNLDSSENQLKDLRLKAKLKITQLQRELDSGKKPGAALPSAEDKTLELQEKIEHLQQELAEARSISISNLSLPGETSDSLNQPADIETSYHLNEKIEELKESLATERASREKAEKDLVDLQKKLNNFELSTLNNNAEDIEIKPDFPIKTLETSEVESPPNNSLADNERHALERQLGENKLAFERQLEENKLAFERQLEENKLAFERRLEENKQKATRLEADNLSMSRMVKILKDENGAFKSEIDSLKSRASTLEESNGQKDAAVRESEEKVKKLKGLLSQASKSMQESKRIIMDKDSSLENLRASLEDVSGKTSNYDSFVEGLRQENDDLNSQLEDLRATLTDQITSMEKKIEELQGENARIKSEFQSYKVKAHAALHQSTFAAVESRAEQLEELKQKLEYENTDLKSQLQAGIEKIRQLESELSSVMDNLNMLESQRRATDDSSREVYSLRQELTGALRRLELEKEVNSEEIALRSKDISHQTALESCRRDFKRVIERIEVELEQKTAELASLSMRCDNLNAQLSQTREDVIRANNEAERAKSAAAAASAAAAGGVASNMSAGNLHGGGFFSTLSAMTSQSSLSLTDNYPSNYEDERRNSRGNAIAQVSLSELLTRPGKSLDLQYPLPAGSGLLASSMKEREMSMRVEQVSELLMEAEKEVSRLSRQEKLLKEEVRRYERVEKLQDLVSHCFFSSRYIITDMKQNIEYLKNVVLSYLETELKEPLIPVISKVLELSPEESERLRKNSRAISREEKARSSLPSLW
ncbi:hypothetical protein HDU67_003273 [Dinochytrium kinnereticum]|nr:hypothetical protein HDU67_003273 [Dinochytrium kinnereticum]